ncbi:P44/Msp2 family outer membrane protein [Neoehrlichia mikurensis]|uniref:P44/Msp2 family outer membrane protein n=1 Tax=Neoehrlichia mikurensis TaxID=89586 RepID=A0ABY5EYW8_9RICK|nr:P44/Msp2 family outer membrane protein [Neoehrlichia mikurensis]UTO56566.1 P44/Msp2 family outer membrane protein [Neoehrlichia mikurensis]
MNANIENSNKCTLKNAYKYFAAAAKLKADKNDEIDDAPTEEKENHNYVLNIKAILALKADAAAENPGADTNNVPSEVSKFIQKPDNFKGFYKPTYNNSFAGFSGLIGYSTPNGVRLELEGSFENFELKNSNKCTLKNAYKYFAAAAKLKAC